MVDESTLRLSFLAALLFVVSLFASWYRRDPLVGVAPLGPSLPLLIAGLTWVVLSLLLFLPSDSLTRFFRTSPLFVSSSMASPCSKMGMRKQTFLFIKCLRCSELTRSDFQATRGLFKTATFRRWMVLASRPELIEDVRKAPDNVLSLMAPAIEVRILPGMLISYS